MKFEAQIGRNSAANSNVGNAISFSQTQDGFLQKVQKSLDRMSELSILAQDVTKTVTDLSNYTVEFAQLKSYVGNVSSKEFNGVSLFSNTSLGVTIDSDATTFGMAAIAVGAGLSGGGLSESYGGISISDSSSAFASLGYIKSAIQNLAAMRANVGANIQRLNLTSDQLTILNENLGAAASRIKDVDVAAESTQYARYNILVQSGTAMLAQANLVPQSALRLLGQ